MIYTNFQELKLSMLGMGGMRFPCHPDGQVDMEKTGELIDMCIRSGINYFDSAWFYHHGKAEEVIGSLLKKYPRGSYYLATKLPWSGYDTAEGMKKLFYTQLERTGAGYFDFYLLHNVSDDNVKIFTDPELGIIDFLQEQKRKGIIRHFGFSTHGSIPMLESFVEKYHSILEFCQIQLNWLDWTLQNAKRKVELLNQYNIPIWVMEPVRGGSLAALSAEQEASLKALRPEESIAAWSFRFLQGIPGVTMVLSGMGTPEQIADNIRTFTESKPLNEQEQKTLLSIADDILAQKTLTCTRCKYCVDDCPAGLEIPKLLALYNQMCLIRDQLNVEQLEKEVGREQFPTACVGCKTCESKCPQNIHISEIMAAFAEKIQAKEQA